ncbi:hypothetical protein LTS12_029779, partial [Elasticomyces elasticus]
MASYVARPFDCEAAFDTSKLAGKTAVVTGVMGDISAEAGQAVESELERTKFVKCDVTKWEDQLEMFREAVKFSPTGNIDIVVANAGLAVPQDSIFTPE